jgi:hypothetical protein
VLSLARRAEAEGRPRGRRRSTLPIPRTADSSCSTTGGPSLYQSLAAFSGVAARLRRVTTTHLNHITPRVLDIDDL